ncbi:MAG: ribokinase [Firmicutes bacterium]|nr:ribokinase [Bacillota bacterium]
MKVLNFGSLNLDYVYQVDHMVQAGETLSSIDRKVFCGGKGLNQSIALARAGAQVYHAGLIGPEGEILVDILKEANVNVELVGQIEEATGHAMIQVDPSGQNCILIYGGANRKIDKDMVDRVLAKFEAGDILVLQNEISELDYIIDRAYEKKMKIVLNPSPWSESLGQIDPAKITLFVCNEIEAQAMTGQQEIQKMLQAMQGKQVVLTVGKDGAWYQDECGMRSFQIAFHVKAVDTTGAGDTFTGYFVENWSKGEDPQLCLKYAAKAAAISVSRPGAAISIPNRDEVYED